MKKREAIPKKRAAVIESGTSGPEDADKRKDELLRKYDLIKGDGVFKKIFSSLEAGWGNLSEENRGRALDYLNEMIEALYSYHDGYRGMKSASFRHFYFDDIKKYQAAVENADPRERMLHNRFMDAVNILSRQMKELGLDNSWRGDEKIYTPNPDPDVARAKLRDWMLEIFGEKIGGGDGGP